ncbi:hypothetical protein FE391_14485 [Nonomuraea sp. KC401]|uniref:Uncharacterized protein n=1 Tax=Nonomuraea longispora TaxID=1848320 RepID=A0A4R4NU55_9ACTN|nr:MULTISPECIES: hypothetical protein [Nonomuraea]NBE92001.1 hypothetical protein [Nonomuraea sp. K271]TDC11487.1 hypothetical protein E1267_00690 [Nonomuraea longispora]TLF74204.1 hypothetical protein FE391_14485 [Nonomuraea sp. KC401]
MYDEPAPPPSLAARVWGLLRQAGTLFRRRLVVIVVVVAVLISTVVLVNYTQGWWPWGGCETQSEDVVAVEGECVGLMDPAEGTMVLGKEYQQLLEVIAAENREVTAEGDYSTIALLAPMGAGPRGLVGDRALHQLEGAFIGQYRANRSETFPKIRLVLANTGHDGSKWRTAVEAVRKNAATGATGIPGQIVAVTGMGPSQQESIDAARALAKDPGIPMVADFITAAGFNTTGEIDDGGPIPGLTRTAVSTSAQLEAIAKELKDKKVKGSAALMWADVTPQGTKDLYAGSLKDAFLDPELGLKEYVDKSGLSFPFDPRGGPSLLRTISDTICGTKTDMIFYAGRQTFMPTFLKLLRNRPCRSTPITVVTGDDAQNQDPNDPSLHDPDAPIKVMFVPLAEPKRLDHEDNEHRQLYQQFRNEFVAPHHGVSFSAAHLGSGLAIMSYDAVTAAATAVQKAAIGADPSQLNLPSTAAVRGQLYLFTGTNAIRGASGAFTLDSRTGERVNLTAPTPVTIP